jgi:hypothetical protein
MEVAATALGLAGLVLAGVKTLSVPGRNTRIEKRRQSKKARKDTFGLTVLPSKVAPLIE